MDILLLGSVCAGFAYMAISSKSEYAAAIFAAAFVCAAIILASII